MRLEIIKQEKTALPRQEVEAHVTFDNNTPSRQELKQSIAAKTKSKENLVIVRSIYTTYGKQEAKITAFVYDNEDALNAIEFKTMIAKNKKVELKKEEAPAEEAPAKTPKDEAAPEEKNSSKAEDSSETSSEKKEESPKENPAEEDKKTQVAEKKEGEQ